MEVVAAVVAAPGTMVARFGAVAGATASDVLTAVVGAACTSIGALSAASSGIGAGLLGAVALVIGLFGAVPPGRRTAIFGVKPIDTRMSYT